MADYMAYMSIKSTSYEQLFGRDHYFSVFHYDLELEGQGHILFSMAENVGVHVKNELEPVPQLIYRTINCNN